MFNAATDMKKSTGRFDGFYRGVVVDNNDPNKAGRVRIRVFPMFQGVQDDHLPWAVMCDPFMGGLNNIGGTFIPNIGAHVFVFFENGDHTQPVYVGGAPAMNDGTPDLPSESSGTYPNNKVYRTKNGIIVELDDEKDNERVRIYHPSGTEMLIDNTGYTLTDVGDTTVDTTGHISVTAGGNMTADVTGDLSATVGGDTTVDVTGGLTATVGGDASLTATNVDATASGNTTLTTTGTTTVSSTGEVVVTGAIIRLN